MICAIASPADGPLLSLRDISPARGGISFATMALQNGVDVKTLSNILGHFSAGFTPDTLARRKHCRYASLGALASLCVFSRLRAAFFAHRARQLLGSHVTTNMQQDAANKVGDFLRESI